jgi:lipopolysaccharide/colanic/teichoic acid biosynthesis glycosyltransferase
MLKRMFDLLLAIVGLVMFWWVILICYVAASIDTRRSGFFHQERVGRDGKKFEIVKIRTMKDDSSNATNVTTANDPRITWLGARLRRFKLDELPQLYNVLKGDMSFVGPRPDVPGFADKLSGEDRIVLSIRPGITGPATLHFRNEEVLLANCGDPEKYNKEVLFPKKTELNIEYIENYRFFDDIAIMYRTIFPND